MITLGAMQTLPRVEKRTTILRVEDVFKIYQEGAVETVALRGASLELYRGEFVALLGKSGSGKSTLLNLIAGIDQPSAGRIWLGEHEITRLDPAARAASRRKQIGFVFQSGNLFPFLSALENVQLALRLDGVPLAAARDRAQELLNQVGLGERQNHAPAQLSGGEAQRAGIACALANRPALVLADELTGELDSATAAVMLDLIDTIHRSENTTFLIVTHNRQVAERAQRILQIRDGIVTEEHHA